MKIGILTLPLHTNYGGVLQAYALQYSLHSMGHEPYLIDCRLDPRYFNFAKRPALGIIRALSWSIPPLAEHLADSELRMRANKVVMRRNVESFIARNIPMRHYFDYCFIAKRDFDAIVVGSDQVWRPQYFKPIFSAYLDFASRWPIRRVAYAASFGLDEWQYSKFQTEQCQRLIKLFDHVSLRESSGVELCRKHLLRRACQVLDPTLLLPKEVYIALVEQAEVQPSGGNMMISLLDSDPDKTVVVERLSAYYSATTFSVNSRVEDRKAPLEERIQPPVEQWLQGFIDVEYVVTDSYHATLFAIIFNKPFVAYANKDRGYTRFWSLLSNLGLERQLLNSSSELLPDNIFDIDWDSVNSKLEFLRDESLGFLSSSLK